ncbi:MAG: hypothetical protein SFX72_10545 [Isosphaeraceae bacterium]|nr:hypothetical protein [Isosphaeraceae bacterium]
MNLDDESLLSAYHDDELAPEERRSLDLALEANPALGDRLREFTELRTLLGSTSTPTSPVDLAPAVVAELRVRRRRSAAFRGALWTATAATVLTAVVLSADPNLFRPKRNAGPIVADRGEPVTKHERSADDRNADPAVETPASLPLVAENSDAATEPTAIVAAPPPPEPEPEIAPAEKLASLLDRSRFRVVEIPESLFGDAAADRVDEILRETIRKDPDYARFRLDAPEAADLGLESASECFVALVDENELHHLVDELQRRFPEVEDRSLESPDVPRLVAAADDVAIRPGRSGASLVEPPAPVEAIASKFSPLDPAREIPRFPPLGRPEIGAFSPPRIPSVEASPPAADPIEPVAPPRKVALIVRVSEE